MNAKCPECGAGLLEPTIELTEWRDGFLEMKTTTADPVPYDDSMLARDLGRGPGPIGGSWFCSKECKTEYKGRGEVADG